MSQPETSGISDLAPSAKLVVKVLEYEESLTQKGLIDHLRLSERTVRNALEQLERIGIVEKGIYIDDARQNRFIAAMKKTRAGCYLRRSFERRNRLRTGVRRFRL